MERANTYVLFVTDAGLAAAANSFEWSAAENGAPPVVQATAHGEFTFRPTAAGPLGLTVRILDGGGAEQASL
ncbi:MAG: hypothetical protein H0U88_04680, partial [Chthoniobacterales bacterium]|nr:hypothetical protein [Chthoniobacterales bacterium]